MYNALKDTICTLHAPVHCVHMQSSIVEQHMYTDREVTLFTKISYTLTTAISTVKNVLVTTELLGSNAFTDCNAYVQFAA